MKKVTWMTMLLVLAGTSASVVMAQTPPPGLIDEWRGDGNVLDSIGTNNGIINPTISYVPGESGQAFNLTGGIISAPDLPVLDSTNVTVQAWVKSFSPGGFSYILCKSRGAGGVSYALYTGGTGTAFFFVNLANGGGTILSAAAPTNVWDNTWHQLTGVFDGTASHLYLDGQEVGPPGTTASTNGIDYSNPQPLVLGDYQVARGIPYVGALDEVKIFGRALSASNVLDSFNNPTNDAATNGLVAWYKAEGNALDSAGTNNGTVSTSRPFTYGAGVLGQALFPQGESALVPDSPGLQPTNFTLQLWAKSVTPGSFDYLVAKYRGAMNGAGAQSWAMYTGGGAGLTFFVNLYNNGATPIFDPAPSIPAAQIWDGAYHLLTGTWDGTVVSLYQDGLLVGSATNASAANGLDYTLARQLVFGDYDFTLSNPGPLPFIGLEDEIQLYNRSLSSSEILNYYSAFGNLVSWWQANSNALDAIGSNNGSLAGGASYSAARTTGKSFNTTAGAVVVPDAPSLRPAALTLQTEVNASSPGTNKYIVSKSFNSTAASYALYTGPNGGLQFYVTINGNKVVSPDAGTALWDGRFHLVDGSYDGQKVHLYVDGAEIGSGTAATGSIQYGTVQSSGELLFGNFSDTLPASNNFVGSIDEVKLYSSALTAQQVDNNSFKQVLILTGPQSQTVAQGTNLTLTVKAQGPSPLSYQWELNGTNIAGATASTLMVSNVQPAQAGQYSVLISGGLAQYTNSTVTTNGKALREGVSGLVEIPDSPAFESQSFTVQLYARAINPGAYKYMISKSRDPIYYSSSYGFYTGGGGSCIWFVVLQPPVSNPTAFGFVPVDAGTNFWDGNWHQFTGTWDGEFVNLYVDGALVQSADSFGGTIDYETSFLNGDLLLGDVLAPTSQYHWPGDLDEVKYFNYPMAADQVLDSYTNQSGFNATNGLVDWYKLDGNTLDALGNDDGHIVPGPGSLLTTPVTITVSAAANLAVIAQARITNHIFSAAVTGPTGQMYIVQRKNTLTGGTWTPIQTNTVPFTFTDAVNMTGANFYRAVSQ